MSEQEKLQRYLEIADQVRFLANDIVNGISLKLRPENEALSFRDRVLLGLALKIYNCFESLVEDARQGRAAAVHHLKTLVETFIYFHWVGQDAGETRAKLVFAIAAHRKLVFFNKNPGYAEPAQYNTWEEGLREIIQGLEREWEEFKKRSLEQLAEESGQNLGQWYERVYRLACEPAHIADLLEHMPLPRRPISLGETQTALLWASIALDYSLHIICHLLKAASDAYELGLNEKIDRLQDRYNAVRAM